MVARDKSLAQNMTEASIEASAFTFRYTCSSSLIVDMTGDCLVDFYDFAMFASEYLVGEIESPANFNADNVVDLADLAMFVHDWLNCGRQPVTECP